MNSLCFEKMMDQVDLSFQIERVLKNENTLIKLNKKHTYQPKKPTIHSKEFKCGSLQI